MEVDLKKKKINACRFYFFFGLGYLVVQCKLGIDHKKTGVQKVKLQKFNFM